VIEAEAAEGQGASDGTEQQRDVVGDGKLHRLRQPTGAAQSTMQ
jgi:hypothetical protein